MTFNEVLAVGERLAALGLKPAVPAKDVICYVEEWTVEAPEDFDGLDAWSTEDVTLVHVRDGWRGDFFLLAGAYHTAYLHFQDVGTYCSISHPWRIRERMILHENRGMFWLGFRHAHSFLRVRLQTREVVTPGETRDDAQRDHWLEERRTAFLEAITTVGLPIDTAIEKGQLVLRPNDPSVPFFCSWPDAFGPCQSVSYTHLRAHETPEHLV